MGLQLFFSFELIKYDFQKDEPLRNGQGWCYRVRKGKMGYKVAVLGKSSESTHAEFRKERLFRMWLTLKCNAGALA